MTGRGRRGWRGLGKSCPRRVFRFVEPCLLLLLHEGEAHGYELMDRLQQFTSEGFQVDSSVVYRTLRTMEKENLVTSEWDTSASAGPPRRIYQLTNDGDAVLAAWVDDLKETVGLLQSFLGAYYHHMKEEEGAYHA